MSLINRHERCIGITLFRLGQIRIEIWMCPSGYEIQEHNHPNENVELMYIFGSCIFYRRNYLIRNSTFESVKTSWKFFGHKFTVNWFHSHKFSVGRLPLIFINFQRFLKNHKPVSAAKDFNIITQAQDERYQVVKDEVTSDAVGCEKV